MIDWDSVKKIALWAYEDLIDKMRLVISYKFVRERYNHNMDEARKYAKNLLSKNDKHQKMLVTLLNVFCKLKAYDIENYSDLLCRVATKEKCEQFLRESGISFLDLIFTLNYIFRWVFPFRNVYLKQLVAPEDKRNLTNVERLGKLNVKFNLDIIEICKTKKERREISTRTGIPENFIEELTNKADLTRLPFMNWKTANHLYNAGYKSLDQLSEVNLAELKTTMKKYFEGRGMKLGPFIDLEGISRWADCIPKIVEN